MTDLERLHQDALDEIERLRASMAPKSLHEARDKIVKLEAEIERLRAEAKRPEDIGMVLERNVMVDVAGVTIRCRAVEDLWRFPGELEDSYDARHEDSAGDDDSGGDAGTDGRDVGDGVPVPGGVRADRVRQGLPDRYPWGDLDADPDTLPFTDPRGDADTYADHHGDTHPD